MYARACPEKRYAERRKSAVPPRRSTSLESLEPGAVPSLLAACRARAGAAQKNAAIACARLARRAAHMAALKEHHGLELIYAYVKP